MLTLKISIFPVSEAGPSHCALLTSILIFCVHNDTVRYNNIYIMCSLALTPILPSWETFSKVVQMMVEHPSLSECFWGYKKRIKLTLRSCLCAVFHYWGMWQLGKVNNCPITLQTSLHTDPRFTTVYSTLWLQLEGLQKRTTNWITSITSTLPYYICTGIAQSHSLGVLQPYLVCFSWIYCGNRHIKCSRSNTGI